LFEYNSNVDGLVEVADGWSQLKTVHVPTFVAVGVALIGIGRTYVVPN